MTPDSSLTPHDPPRIELGQFLKRVGAVSTGGQAKVLIQEGYVTVNDVVETRRRRKLVAGDRVVVQGRPFTVELD
ncbi:MAG: RNA-binding S4 domain-containing protein [Spirulinaceae cyanobacterium SM2_1_0]|nr:RNA-binding S4 domain-containing protein [Spirulinaceae cyanobacterium SM2_1_0]